MSSLEAQARNFWEVRGQRIEAPTKAVLLAPVSEEEALFLDLLEKRQLLPWMGISAGIRILDIGCGVGRWTREMAKRGALVTGIDVSQGFLDEARRAVEADGTSAQVTLLRVDLSSGHLPEEIVGPFDVIFIGGVLQYVEDSAILSLTTLLHQKLSLGGRLIMREGVRKEHHREERGSFEGIPYSVIYRDRTEYPRLFSEAGFHLVKQANLSGFPVVDLVERLLRLTGKGTYGSADTLQLSPESPLWGKFITTVSPFFAYIWPRADRGAVVLHKLLGDKTFQASHQVYWFE